MLGANLEYAGDPRAAATLAVGLERAGVDVLWVSEAYGFDSPTLLGHLAALTSRVRLGASILSVFSRTPTLIAQTAAGLDAVSGGRAVLGLGASGPQVVEGWHGVPYDRPLARTRDVVAICRSAWRREVVEHDGVLRIPLPPGDGTGLGKPLKMLTRPVRGAIPVFLAALGDRNVELAAEIADGWIPYFYFPERAAGTWGAALAAGMQRRDPALGPLQVVASAPLAIAAHGATRADVDRLRDLARPKLALYIGGMGARGRNFYHDVVVRYGYEQAADAVQDAFLAGRREEAESLVPDDLIAGTSLIGTRGWVRERVAAYRDAGVAVLNVAPVGPDPLGDVAFVRDCLEGSV